MNCTQASNNKLAAMSKAGSVPAKAKAAFFRGDSEDLVDALVEACAKKIPTGPIVERELQPYFSVEEAKALASGGPVNQQKSRNAQATSAAQEQQLKRKASPGFTRAGSPQAVHANKAGRKQRGSGCGTPAMSTSPAARLDGADANMPRTPSPPAQHRGHRVANKSASLTFACPAMMSSPKPVDIPLPSMGLMMRAGLLCQAVA